MQLRLLLPTTLALALSASTALAQSPAFSSPGMQRWRGTGQLDRFSNDFNPAIGLAIDVVGDYLKRDEGEDGADIQVRILELNANAWVDPDAWTWVTISSHGLETLAVEEAAVEYVGFQGTSTIRAGQFFVDFGKQMQVHLEELRTLERPLVLRTYLAEELAGTGVQFDHWLALADDIPLRFSAAGYGSLVGHHHAHGEEEHDHEGEEGHHQAEAFDSGRKRLNEFSWTLRATAMKDVGDWSQIQLGASARGIPNFSFEADEVVAEDLSNTVWGLDLTFGTQDLTGNRKFTIGGEWLQSRGDLYAELEEGNTELEVVNDTVSGYYAFADFAYSPWNSVGLQYSQAELLEAPGNHAGELDAYFTWNMTEMRRLRFGVTLGESDLHGDSSRFYIQFTNFIGSHAHGVNW